MISENKCCPARRKDGCIPSFNGWFRSTWEWFNLNKEVCLVNYKAIYRLNRENWHGFCGSKPAHLLDQIGIKLPKGTASKCKVMAT
jgi:hypothetical protein